MQKNRKQKWKEYCLKQLGIITPLLLREGFILDSYQPHLQGERYMLSGAKLVLYGARTEDNLKVVIKITNDLKKSEEIKKEIESREILNSINFAYHPFKSPKEILSGENNGYTFLITEYIEEETPFLKRQAKEQFFLALKAFEAQEGAHITTHEHMRSLKKKIDIYDAKKYTNTFEKYKNEIIKIEQKNKELHKTISDAFNLFKDNEKIIETYSDFLTHWDFVPHNIRIKNGNIYLLDHSSIRFGNKYESWSRFMNFMLLHNENVEEMLKKYIKENRNENENISLRMMRIFRLTELVWFYITKQKKAEGNLLKLTTERICLWSNILKAQVKNETPDKQLIEKYKKRRDELRDDEEKKRQEKLY
jgi:hypothetical protein